MICEKKRAKSLKIKGHSRLRKQELIDRIRTATNILDKEVPDIDSPILRSTRAVTPQSTDSPSDQQKEIREIDEMLGWRKKRASATSVPLPKIKITDPEEAEREMKINMIKEISSRRNQFSVTETVSAFRGFVRQFRILGPSLSGKREFTQMVREVVLNLNRRTRVILIFNTEMERQELFGGGTEILDAHFGIYAIENLMSTDESGEFNFTIRDIEERIQNFNQRGSNWRFQRVLSLDVHFTDYRPLRGLSFFKLPKAIKDKKVVINLKNEDEQCFKHGA